MFGIEVVPTLLRMGGGLGVGVWAASPYKSTGQQMIVEDDARRRMMGLLGVGLVVLGAKAPAKAKPAVYAAAGGLLALYAYKSVNLYRQAVDGEAPGVSALLGVAKGDVGLNRQEG